MVETIVGKVKFTYEDLTEEQIAELQSPANETMETIVSSESGRVEAEAERVAAESGRVEAEAQRVLLYEAIDETIDERVDNKLNSYETIDNSSFSMQTYYTVNAYSVGDTVLHENVANTYSYAYNSYFVSSDETLGVVISGTGGSLSSRLYMVVSNETNKVLEIAASGVVMEDYYITYENARIYITVSQSDSYSLKVLSRSVYNLFGDVAAVEESIEELYDKVETITPMMYNPPLDLRRSTLRVLDIGNSYTVDVTSYLDNLITASGVDVDDMCIYYANRGSASYKNWYDVYHDTDTSTYTIGQIAGGLDSDIVTGTGAIGDGELFRKALSDNEWDLIIIHQYSSYAPYYDQWEDDSNAGYLSQLIRLLRMHQPQATLGFLLTHSYASNYGSNSEGSSLDRWQLIADSAKRLRVNYGFDFIIPYGTAVQNLRSSSLNTLNSDTGYYNDFTTDGTHCASGLGDYVASCCYFQSLIAPRYGVSVLGNSYNSITVSNSTGTYQGGISVTPENAWVAQKAGFIAAYNWYENINPEDIYLGENPFAVEV